MAKVTAQRAVGTGAGTLHEWEYIKCGESLKSFENEVKIFWLGEKRRSQGNLKGGTFR